MSDSTYHIAPHDWPVGVGVNEMPNVEALDAVLDEFEVFYPMAVAGLAQTVIPGPNNDGPPVTHGS